jgi:heme-degrading monooxygenase HmoA
VALSRFVVANGMEEDVAAAFLARPHLVDDARGFIRMQVMRPTEDPREFWLWTWWNSAEDCHAWHKSHAYRASHAGIPRGLKLVPRSTRISYFHQVCE